MKKSAKITSVTSIDDIGHLEMSSSEELWAFWSKYRTANKTQAYAFFGGSPKGYREALQVLANFSCNKAIAVKCRLEGDILTASIYEHCCELSYDRLPTYARW